MVRVKRRYIVVKLVKKKAKDKFQDYDLQNEIRNQVEQMYGDFGIGCLRRAFAIKKFDDNHGFAIIQVRKGTHEMVMSTLPLITQINNVSCTVNIIHLSGTLRCCLKVLRIDYIHLLRKSIGQMIASNQVSRNKTIDLSLLGS